MKAHRGSKMSDFDIRRLVLIHSVIKGSDGQEIHKYGTGYFVTHNLVLTASHVLPTGSVEQIEVRLEASQNRAGYPWVDVEKEPVWKNVQLDAVLIKVIHPIAGIEAPHWGQTDFTENKDWDSVAYPEASTQKVEGRTEWKTSGL